MDYQYPSIEDIQTMTVRLKFLPHNVRQVITKSRLVDDLTLYWQVMLIELCQNHSAERVYKSLVLTKKLKNRLEQGAVEKLTLFYCGDGYVEDSGHEETYLRHLKRTNRCLGHRQDGGKLIPTSRRSASSSIGSTNSVPISSFPQVRLPTKDFATRSPGIASVAADPDH